MLFLYVKVIIFSVLLSRNKSTKKSPLTIRDGRQVAADKRFAHFDILRLTFKVLHDII